jgi:recombination protein RecA
MKRKPLKNKGGGSDASTRISKRISEGGSYFGKPKEHIQFISSGSKFLDLVLGGGWAEGRISNVVGDKAVGKTLIAIEAAANFARKYEKGTIFYRESEAAFDTEYAEALGMPINRVEFASPVTVEDFFEDVSDVLARNKKRPCLYVLDSLDALSDRSEMQREMDQGTYGANKAKQLSQLFRRLVVDMSKANLTLMVISQIRDAIGVTFGRKYKRSGGHAMDFYASQIIYLSQMGQLSRTISGIKRPIGIEVKAKTDKNKVGLPYREAQFSVLFGYGIDDAQGCLDWLAEANGLQDLGLTKEQVKHAYGAQSKYVKWLGSQSEGEFRKVMQKIHAAVDKKWWEVERSFLPKRQKYR